MIADTGCDGIGLDFTVDIADARQRVGHQVALQGNMDPVVMNTSPEVVIQQAKKVIDSYGQHCSGQGHVFNLGHGIQPHADPEHMTILVETVRNHSQQYHSA